MAVVVSNPFLRGIKGTLGDLVFRIVNGQTVVSAASVQSRSAKKRETGLQRHCRSRFRRATEFAKAMMRDPVKREHYRRKARKMKLPNGYTAAITEYMRNASISDVDTRQYTGKAGGRIKIATKKKDFSVTRVTVTITTKAGQEIEKGQAVQTNAGVWTYRNKASAVSLEGLTVAIEAADAIGNATRCHQVLGERHFSPPVKYFAV